MEHQNSEASPKERRWAIWAGFLQFNLTWIIGSITMFLGWRFVLGADIKHAWAIILLNFGHSLMIHISFYVTRKMMNEKLDCEEKDVCNSDN